MQLNNCFELGNIIKPHGLKGQVLVELDSDQPEAYEKLESVFLQLHGNLVPFFIQSLEIDGSKARIGFEDILTEDQARELQGVKIFLPLDQLPPLKKEDQFYFHELTGFELWEGSRSVGIIKDIVNLPKNDLILAEYQGKEWMLPLQDDFLEKLDREQKRLYVKVPEGLIDLYLSE